MKLICNVDCMGLLQALQDEENKYFFLILEDIQELLRRSWSVTLENIGRECNEPSDWLAKRRASSQSLAWSLVKDLLWGIGDPHP